MGKILVYIDGDNVYDASLVSKLYRKDSKTECFFVRNNSHPPKQIARLGIPSIIPPCIGKEAVDMYIAMDAMYRCTCQDVGEVHIVSSDGDTLEILLNLATYFKATKFYWLRPHNGKPTSLKSLSSVKSLPDNVIFVQVR